MNMVTIIASALLVIGCLYIIFSPFMQRTVDNIDHQVMAFDDALTKKELYATLNEIEMDYKMHKLSEIDYRTMKSTYEKMVADIMKSETRITSKISSMPNVHEEVIQQIENEIETELYAYRNERKGDI
ncbi:hypothetical protein [Bacillus sp. Marseille-P3661]|uniref:hypothetical protein n=1 Tax=Bacillus sp. Marseille-P3661 TaxID=1936234 RepID=UPI000C836AD0|nr:hypothetical protein [Bacillus sp. Marseille-P3661]